MKKSRGIWWAWHVSRIWAMQNAHKGFVGKCEDRMPLRKKKCISDDNFKPFL